MPMLLKRSELVAALDAVKGGVAQKAFSPILTHVLIEGDTVLSFDSEIGVKVKLSTPIMGKFNARFDMLYNLLKSLDGEDVAIEVDGTKVRVQCGRHRSFLQQIAEDFPRPQIVGAGGWNPVPPGFKEALERVLLGVHESEQEKLLSCVMLDGATLQSHNRAVCVVCTLPDMRAPQALLSRKAVTELIRLGQPTRFAIAGPWSIWDYGNLTFLARLREGATEFPKLPELMTRFKLDERVMGPVPDGLMGALTRLSLFCGVEKQTIMRPGSNEGGSWTELVSQNEQGTAEEMLDDVDGVADKRFNPDMLNKALVYASGISWGTTTTDPIYIVGEVAGLQYLLSPMRPGVAA